MSIAESSQTNKAQCSYTRQIYRDCKYLLNAVNIAHTFVLWSHIAHTRVNIWNAFLTEKLLSFLIKWQAYYWPLFYMVTSILSLMTVFSMVWCLLFYDVILRYLWCFKVLNAKLPSLRKSINAKMKSILSFCINVNKNIVVGWQASNRRLIMLVLCVES